jgi:hypothetical protein
MAQGPETKLVNAIVKYLKQRGGVVFKIHGGPYQAAGIPDLYYAEAGKSFWFEVKQPGEPHPVTALQQKTINDLRKQQVRAEVVHSVEEVDMRIRYALYR